METNEPMPRCICGKPVDFWSGLLDQGFCSDNCYEKAKEKINEPMQHGAL